MKKLLKKVVMNYKYAKKINSLTNYLHNLYISNIVLCTDSSDYKCGYRLTINYLNKLIQKNNKSIFSRIHDYKEMIMAFKNYSHKDISYIFHEEPMSVLFKGAIAASADFRKLIDLQVDEVNQDILKLYKA
ncbi:hypothetical protein UFOVP459_48 [uncultured Caudovirales phage]|uniref:Uncharacterized protein n=1 Tax=uncultured Caudovirales phage TaxID=2100421 RepID=A0A6J5SGT0_9CAUD|nr:hypothetical protein UFOVP459_48 [uncultured Caudovirales phage]CAB4183086.1 hypothetical protein UFOVP1089_37 [uncultured Caudovirales phage]CAB4213018.1 hypothetical protein UFOVP1443_56 [uncultured Caudovirales phage]